MAATLFALGIHEDTGSLSYGGTTHRDVYALAWLMEPERGVNLDVVSQFLRHPLSEAQRHLLATLIEQSEFLEIAGHTVVIAQASAPEFDDSISTLAHRLRDIHEVDAIFLVVGLGDIVQVVARSTVDDIDVGEVARALGGGGHVRASGRTSARYRSASGARPHCQLDPGKDAPGSDCTPDHEYRAPADLDANDDDRAGGGLNAPLRPRRFPSY